MSEAGGVSEVGDARDPGDLRDVRDPGGAAPRRMFFAFWPDGAVLDQLAALAAAAAGRYGARAVLAPDLHLTLQFLGKISPGQVQGLRSACAERAAGGAPADCEFALQRIEYWPGSRTLSLISANRPDSALALVAALVAQSASLGIAKPVLDWVPHVTLAQVPKAEPEPVGWSLTEAVRWRVNRFSLVESRDDVGRDEPRYRILESWPATKMT